MLTIPLIDTINSMHVALGHGRIVLRKQDHNTYLNYILADNDTQARACETSKAVSTVASELHTM
jgi:hypothetical protein